MPRKYALTLLLIFLLALPGCSVLQTPAEQAESAANNDPLEPMNRSIFDRYIFLDQLLVRPLAELYRATIPPGIRDRVANILANMKEPVVFANNLLQGDFASAGTTLERFGINTTVGVGGMWDFAGPWGMHQQTGDFGQTLAVWGVGEGPYLMLPVFGPSNFRDATGRFVDIVLSPWQYVAYFDGGTNALVDYELSYFGSDVLVRREQNIEKFDAVRAGSVDLYATVRSAYRQSRRKQLGEPQENPGFEEEKE